MSAAATGEPPSYFEEEARKDAKIKQLFETGGTTENIRRFYKVYVENYVETPKPRFEGDSSIPYGKLNEGKQEFAVIFTKRGSTSTIEGKLIGTMITETTDEIIYNFVVRTGDTNNILRRRDITSITVNVSPSGGARRKTRRRYRKRRTTRRR